MEITEVRIKLMDEPSERLKAFCSVTVDECFVVRDLKIIEGSSGPFVAMPSRKLTAHCHQCRMKNHLRSAYCNQCGSKLDADRAFKDEDGRAKLYADIAHPINSDCREKIQVKVLHEFRLEQERSRDPNYISRYDEYYGESSSPSVDRSPTRIDGPHGKPAAHQPRGPIPQDTARASHPHNPPAAHSAKRSNDGFGAGII